MGRPKKSDAETPTATSGHNVTPLTLDDQIALGVHHQLKITAEQRKLDALLVDVSNQRKVVNGAFKRMTADLGDSRKDFQAEVIDKLQMSPTEYATHLKKVDRLHRIAGLKEGEQIDWLEHVVNDTVDESEAAFQDGYRAGRRADDPAPPSHVSGIMVPKWMEGWHAGQAYNGEQLKRAHEVLARPKPGTMAAAPDEDEADEDDEDGIDDEVRRLEKAGWAAPTEAEAKFVEADNGRTIRAIEEAA